MGRAPPAPSRTGATSTGSTATTALASSPTVGTSTGSTAAPALASSPTPGTGAAALTGRPRGPAPGRAGAGEAAPAGTAGGARVSRPRPRPPRGGRTPTRDTEEGEAAGRPGDAEVRGELRAALAAGEQAMRDGDLRRAIVLAERALRHGGGPAAHSLHARASCGLGDLGNAKASFLRIPRRDRALRRVVTAACSRAGIDVGR